MIFSKRRRDVLEDSGHILVRAAEGIPSFSTSKAPEAIGDWRKRTDTDGTERRARQAKQDNELL